MFTKFLILLRGYGEEETKRMEASDGVHTNRDLIEDLFVSVRHALDESRLSIRSKYDRRDGNSNTVSSAARLGRIVETGRVGSPLSTTTHHRSSFGNAGSWLEGEPAGVSVAGQGLCEEDQATLNVVLDMTGRSRSHERILESTIQTNAEETLRSLGERRRRAAAARRAGVGFIASRRAAFDHSVECKLAQARAQGLMNSRRLVLWEREATRRLQEFLHGCLGEYEKERIRRERRRVSSDESCNATLAEKISDLRWSRFCTRLEEDAFGLVEAQDLGDPSRFARDSTINARDRSSCTAEAAASTVTSRLATILARAGLPSARIARIVGLRPRDNSGGTATPGGSEECLLIIKELEKSRALVHGEVTVVAGNSPLDVVDVIRRAALCGNRGLEAALPLSVVPAANSSPSRVNRASVWRARALASLFGGNQMNADDDYRECSSRGEEEEDEGLRAEDEQERCCAVVVAAEPRDLLSSSPIAWTLRAPFDDNGMIATTTDGLCRGSDSDINRDSAAGDRNSEGEGIRGAGDLRSNARGLKHGFRDSLARNLAWVSASPVGCRVYYCLEEALWEASRLEIEDPRRWGQSAVLEQASVLHDGDGGENEESDNPPQKLVTEEERRKYATGSDNAGEEVFGVDVFRVGSEDRFKKEFRRTEGSNSDGCSTSDFISESDNKVTERCTDPRGAHLWESVVLKADVSVTEAVTASFVVNDVIDGRRTHFPRPNADNQRRIREEGGSRAGHRVARSEPHPDVLDILVARVNEPGVSTQKDKSRRGRESRSASSPVSFGDTGLGVDSARLQQPLWKGCSGGGVCEGEEGRNRRIGYDDLCRPTATNHGTALLHFIPARVEQLLGTPQCREFVDALPSKVRERVLTRYGGFLDRVPPIGKLYVPLDSPYGLEVPCEHSGTEECCSKRVGEGKDDPLSESRREVFGAGTDRLGDNSVGISSSGSGLRSRPLLRALVHPLPVRAVRELLQIHVATTRAVCAVNVDGVAGDSCSRRSSGLFVPQPTLPEWISFDVGEEVASVVNGGRRADFNAVREGVTRGWRPGSLNPATTPPSAVDVLPDSPLTPLPRDGLDVIYRRRQGAQREGNTVTSSIAASLLVPFCHTYVAVLASAAGGFNGSNGGVRPRGKEGKARQDPLPGAMTSLLLQVEVEHKKAAKCSEGGGDMHAGVCAWRACVADAVVGSVLCAVHVRLHDFLDNEAAQAGCPSEALCFLPPNGSGLKRRSSVRGRRRRRSSSGGNGTSITAAGDGEIEIPTEIGVVQETDDDISAVLETMSPPLTELLLDGKLGMAIEAFFGKAVVGVHRGLGRYEGDDGREGQNGTIGRAPIWARWTNISEAETVERKLEADLCWIQQVVQMEEKATTELRRCSGLGVFPASELAIIRRERENLAIPEVWEAVKESESHEHPERKEGRPHLSSTAAVLPHNANLGLRNALGGNRSLWSHRGCRRSTSSQANLWNASGLSTATARVIARTEQEEEEGICSDIYGGGFDGTGDRYSVEGNAELEFSRFKMALLKSRRQEAERRRVVSKG